MKKIFTVALMSVAALSMTAGVNVASVKGAQVDKSAKSIKVRKGVAGEARMTRADISEYENYTWTLLGDGKYKSSAVAGTYQTSTDLMPVKVYEAEGHKGVYKAVGVWADLLEVDTQALIVDASNPDFVLVPKQFTGINDQVDNETYIASQTWVLQNENGYTAEQIIAGAPEIVPTLENSVVTFPAKSLVLNWPNAPADSKYETDPEGWYYGGDDAGCLVLPGGEYKEPWTLYGKATMSGDWLFATFGKTAAPYETEVYVATEDATKFKVKNPLKGLYGALGFNGVSPDFELDASNVNDVVLEMTSTGINGGTTDGLYYIFNEGYYSQLENVATDEALCTKLEVNEKTAVFTFPAESLTLFAQTSQQFFYGNAEESAVITVERSSSGVNSVNMEVSQAAPEYYNLQGLRVAEPQSGSLVICRQGDKVSKVIVK